MGPTARHSTGRKATRRPARQARRRLADQERQSPKIDLEAILGRLSDALSIITTATHALTSAQDRVSVEVPYDPGETVHTLTHGVKALRRVYDALDGAIMERSGARV